MIHLRPYQQDFIAELRSSLAKHRSVVGVAPTGSGKTICFSYIASRARERGKRIGIFAHRAELLDQISRTLRQFSVPHGMITAGVTVDRRHSVYVCSAQTYARRGVQVPPFDLGVIDEAHHATSGSTWGKCMDRSPNARWIGVTATPERLDGRGLSEMFDDMVMGPSVSSLIEAGNLSRYRLFTPSHIDLSAVHTLAGDFKRNESEAAVDKPAITGDVVKHYRKHLNGTPTVAFCVSVAHAQHVAEVFRAQGFTAASVDGKMGKQERKAIIDDFSAGRLSVLTSADLISEGFDVPGIYGAILLRPTKSLALYLQQVGRALRPCEGKPAATILDHVGNCERHGLPDDDRDWTLEGRRKIKMATPAETTRECPDCFRRFSLFLRQCPECGYAVQVKPREILEREGELSEVNLDEARAARKKKSPLAKAQARARSKEALVDLFIRDYTAKGIVIDDETRARAARRADHVLNARRRGYGQGHHARRAS